MKLLGRGKVHFTDTDRKGEDNNVARYRAEETYVNEEVYIFGSCEYVDR